MAGSYLKSLQLAKQLEERAKEASRNKELAEKEFAELEQFLKACSEADADLSAVEQPKKDYEAAMAVKDYQTALGHVRKAKEAAKQAYLKKVADVGDSVEALIGLVRGAGGDAKSAQELLEKSKERVVNDDLIGAMKHAKSAYDAAERALHELFSQLFSQAQEAIMQAKEMGADVSIFEDQLSKAKAALDKQDYETCMSLINDVLDGAGEDLKTLVGSTISRAEELISAGDELGADMSRVKSLVERAGAALSSRRYKEALSYAKKAESEGENSISTRFQELAKETREILRKMRNAKKDVTTPQQLLDQATAAMKEKKYIEALRALNMAHEHVHQAEFNAVLQVISEARDKFVLAKKVGVDMTKAILLLNTARDNLKLGKFEDAISYAEQSKKEVEAALEKFYRARDQIVELAKAIKHAAGLGLDSTTAKGTLTEARKSFEARDYDRTAELTKAGLADVKKMVYDAAMGAIDAADRTLKLGKQLGAEIAEAEGILQNALDALSKEDMAESIRLAKESKSASDQAMTRLMTDRLQSIDEFIRKYAGESLEELEGMMAAARQHVESLEFEKANELLKQVTLRIENIGQAECERLIASAKERIDAAKSMGGDVAPLEILLTRASDSLGKRIYEDAMLKAREIVQQADELMKGLVQAELSSVKDYLEEAKTIGIDTDEAKTQLKEARAKADSGDFPGAHAAIVQTKEALKAAIARHDSIKAKVHRTEELISEAGKTKADVSHLVRKLDEARNAFMSGDLDTAEQLIDSTMAEAEKSLAMYLAAKTILTAKESLDLAQAHGIEVGEPLALLSRAKELMKQKSYEEALGTARKAEEGARERLSSAINQMTKDLQRLIADARNVGVDTSGPEKLAEKAAELAKKGDFSEALRCISSAKEDIDHVKNLSSQAALEIRVARNNLKDAETLDIDVGKAREYLEQAVEALTRHQYAIALELARKSSDLSTEITKSRILKTLEKFKEKLDKAAADGVQVGLADRYVAEGFQAFKEGRYQDALKLAMKCEMEMERVELQRDISARAVELARKKLMDAAQEGIQSPRLDALVEKAEAFFKQGKYVEAMTAAIETGDEIHAIKENLDSCRIELSAAQERIERLRRVNIDTRECDEILTMAKEYLASHDFAKTREALKRASNKAAALFEASIKDIMEQNRMMISKAKAMGINAKQCEDLLEVANTSFQEKLWDFAYQQAIACRNTCIELMSKKLSALETELREKVEAAKRMGASVRTVEDMLEQAREVAQAGDDSVAFQMLMDAERRLLAIEEAHRKYLDISIAAESAMETLGRFGISKREPERLMAMAEIEKEKDYDSAIELVAEALDTAKELMEAYSPELTGSLVATGLQAEAEGELSVKLRNTGKALAKDVSVEVSGDFDVREVQKVDGIKPGAEATVTVRLVPRRSGTVPIKVTLSCKRQFDGKLQSFEIEDTLNVFPAGPPFKLGRATEITRCIACQGRIKPGFDIVTCRCGGQLHLSCAKRAGACPICGQKYSF